LFFEVKTDLHFEGGRRVAGELWFNLQHLPAAKIEKGRFEARKAVQAPTYIDNGLHERTRTELGVGAVGGELRFGDFRFDGSGSRLFDGVGHDGLWDDARRRGIAVGVREGTTFSTGHNSDTPKTKLAGGG
jgi:hypothetical protein